GGQFFGGAGNLVGAVADVADQFAQAVAHRGDALLQHAEFIAARRQWAHAEVATGNPVGRREGVLQGSDDLAGDDACHQQAQQYRAQGGKQDGQFGETGLFQTLFEQCLIQGATSVEQVVFGGAQVLHGLVFTDKSGGTALVSRQVGAHRVTRRHQQRFAVVEVRRTVV